MKLIFLLSIILYTNSTLAYTLVIREEHFKLSCEFLTKITSKENIDKATFYFVRKPNVSSKPIDSIQHLVYILAYHNEDNGQITSLNNLTYKYLDFHTTSDKQINFHKSTIRSLSIGDNINDMMKTDSDDHIIFCIKDTNFDLINGISIKTDVLVTQKEKLPLSLFMMVGIKIDGDLKANKSRQTPNQINYFWHKNVFRTRKVVLPYSVYKPNSSLATMNSLDDLLDLFNNNSYVYSGKMMVEGIAQDRFLHQSLIIRRFERYNELNACVYNSSTSKTSNSSSIICFIIRQKLNATKDFNELNFYLSRLIDHENNIQILNSYEEQLTAHQINHNEFELTFADGLKFTINVTSLVILSLSSSQIKGVTGNVKYIDFTYKELLQLTKNAYENPELYQETDRVNSFPMRSLARYTTDNDKIASSVAAKEHPKTSSEVETTETTQ